MRPQAALLAWIGLAGAADVAAQPAAPRACQAELGATRAAQLVRDCLESRPAMPGICRLETSCAAMRKAIEAACRLPDTEARPVCDDDDDDDEDE